MSFTKLIIGSRGSALALAQSEWVAGELRRSHPGLDVTIRRISTRGDRLQDVPLDRVGGKGVFTREIDLALARGEIHVAVHSLKDVPTEPVDGVELAAVPRRFSPHDVLITRDRLVPDDLPRGAAVGTSSLRRRAQLLAWRPDLKVVDLRGNVDTRIRRIDEGRVDGAVLAEAGLLRLGLPRPRIILPFSRMLPAPGQGALAVTTRAGDGESYRLARSVHDPASADGAWMEREVLRRLGGGCQIPFGAAAVPLPCGEYRLEAGLFAPDGSRSLRAEAQGPAGEELPNHVLRRLEQQGLREFLDEIRNSIKSCPGMADSVHGGENTPQPGNG